MSDHASIVNSYFEDLHRGDIEALLARLAEDIVRTGPDDDHLVGKIAVERAVRHQAQASPTFVLHRLVEDGPTVVAMGIVESGRSEGSTERHSFCDVFTFEGDLITRVETELIPIGP